jgi:hypothetical protein
MKACCFIDMGKGQSAQDAMTGPLQLKRAINAGAQTGWSFHAITVKGSGSPLPLIAVIGK